MCVCVCLSVCLSVCVCVTFAYYFFAYYFFSNFTYYFFTYFFVFYGVSVSARTCASTRVSACVHKTRISYSYSLATLLSYTCKRPSYWISAPPQKNHENAPEKSNSIEYYPGKLCKNLWWTKSQEILNHVDLCVCVFLQLYCWLASFILHIK